MENENKNPFAGNTGGFLNDALSFNRPPEVHAFEVQREIVQCLIHKWWFFLLGMPSSNREYVKQLTDKYCTPEKNYRQWGIWLAVHNLPLLVVGIPPECISLQQMQDEMNLYHHTMVGDATEGASVMEGAIIVPVYSTVGGAERQMNLCREAFDQFIKHPFSAPPVPFHGGPTHITPQAVSPYPQAPRVIGMTEWLETGNPYVPKINVIAWWLDIGDEFQIVFVTEELSPDNMVTGRTVGMFPRSVTTDDHTVEAVALAGKYLLEVKESFTRERDAVLRSRPPAPPQPPQGAPPQ